MPPYILPYSLQKIDAIFKIADIKFVEKYEFK